MKEWNLEDLGFFYEQTESWDIGSKLAKNQYSEKTIHFKMSKDLFKELNNNET